MGGLYYSIMGYSVNHRGFVKSCHPSRLQERPGYLLLTSLGSCWQGKDMYIIMQRWSVLGLAGVYLIQFLFINCTSVSYYSSIRVDQQQVNQTCNDQQTTGMSTNISCGVVCSQLAYCQAFVIVAGKWLVCGEGALHELVMGGWGSPADPHVFMKRDTSGEYTSLSNTSSNWVKLFLSHQYHIVLYSSLGVEAQNDSIQIIRLMYHYLKYSWL